MQLALHFRLIQKVNNIFPGRKVCKVIELAAFVGGKDFLYGVIREQLVNFLMGFGKAVVQPMYHKNNGIVFQFPK